MHRYTCYAGIEQMTILTICLNLLNLYCQDKKEFPRGQTMVAQVTALHVQKTITDHSILKHLISY